eukprot:jgi/Astpho2/3170/Aster-05703
MPNQKRGREPLNLPPPDASNLLCMHNAAKNGRRGQRNPTPKRNAVLRAQDEKLPFVDYRRSPESAAAIQREMQRVLRDSRASSEVPPQLLVKVHERNVSVNNVEVKARHLWGCDVYTDDSDVVAALMHCGFHEAAKAHNPPGSQEYRVVVTVMSPQQSYGADLRYTLRSRAWGTTTIGCSFKVKIERCTLLLRNGNLVALEPFTGVGSQLEPTFVPTHHERSMNTRGQVSSHERRQRNVKEVTLLYNLCNEPWLKYTMAAVADRGLKPSQWTSVRLQTEVMLAETRTQRFELSRVGEPPTEGTPEPQADTYRWARCNQALPLSYLHALGLPLPENQLAVWEPRLQWEELQLIVQLCLLQWGSDGVRIKGKLEPLMKVHWIPRQRPGSAAPVSGTVSSMDED